MLTLEDTTLPTASVVSPSGGEYWLVSEPGSDSNHQLITWSMSDNVRVCHVEADLLYSSDGGVNYSPVLAAVNVAPANPGGTASFGPGGTCTYKDQVTTTSLTYSVPTNFPSGTPGSLYKVEVRVTDHANRMTTVRSNGPFYIVRPNPDTVRTLILTHSGRLTSFYSASRAAAVATKLQELAGHPRVQGFVVDLAGVADLTSLYAAWDAASDDPDKANQVLFGCHDPLPVGCSGELDGVHDVIRQLLAAYSGVKYLILAGDDRVIPLARLTDHAILLPESTYTDGVNLTSTGTTVGQALSVNRYLSDDPLAVQDSVHAGQMSGSLYLPDLAVGRLVETPEEMTTSIATFISKDGVLDVSALDSTTGHKVLVTGYDFLSDSAKRVRGRWKSVTTGEDPLQIAGLDASQIATMDLSGSVIYAVGCHGGLPVAGSTAPEDHPLDLPQAFLSRGVVAYVANTGYGWGLKNGIGYGERLVEVLTEEMTKGGTVVVGDAVKRTKQRYYLETPRYDVYDEKSLMQWTLFGLPMYAVKTGIATGQGFAPSATSSRTRGRQAPASGADRVKVSRRLLGAASAARAFQPAMDAAALPGYLTQLNLHFDLTASGVYVKRNSAGDTLPMTPGCSDPNGCYYTLNGMVERSTGGTDLPVQPYFIYDSRLSGTSQHGVLWKGGVFDQESGWTPVIAELASNGGDGSDHGSSPRVGKIRATAPRLVPGQDPELCRPSDLELNSLVVTTGEALKNQEADPVYTMERRYREVDLEVFYFNDTADPVQNCDRTGPALETGPYSGLYHHSSAGLVEWAVPATDASGVWRVIVVVNDNTVHGQGRGTWVPVELTDDGSGTFRGSRAVGSTRVTYVVQAVDNRGNVTWLDYVAAQLPASGVSTAAPAAVDVTVTLPPSPAITGFTPVSGPVGSQVSVTGSGFLGASSATVGGVAAGFAVNSATSITVLIPLGAISGPLVATAPGGTATSAASFTVTPPIPPPPTITTFSPTSGIVGTVVTITGTNLLETQVVTIGGVTVAFIVVSDGELQATVSAATLSGSIVVTTSGGTATSATSFTVLQPPTITTFRPARGVVGTYVSISGTGFQGATAVAFAGVTAAFTVNSDTSITAQVAAGAVTGPIAVTTPGGVAVSMTSFTVVAAVGPTLSINDLRVVEGNSGTRAAYFQIRLSAVSTRTVTVAYGFGGGTATRGVDYKVGTPSGTVVFPPGMTVRKLGFQVVGDAVPEADEIFQVTLSHPVNAIVQKAVGTATIGNDD